MYPLKKGPFLLTTHTPPRPQIDDRHYSVVRNGFLLPIVKSRVRALRAFFRVRLFVSVV